MFYLSSGGNILQDKRPFTITHVVECDHWFTICLLVLILSTWSIWLLFFLHNYYSSLTWNGAHLTKSQIHESLWMSGHELSPRQRLTSVVKMRNGLCLLLTVRTVSFHEFLSLKLTQFKSSQPLETNSSASNYVMYHECAADVTEAIFPE